MIKLKAIFETQANGPKIIDRRGLGTFTKFILINTERLQTNIPGPSGRAKGDLPSAVRRCV